MEQDTSSKTEERAPGAQRDGQQSVKTYLLGFGLAVMLTLGSFWAAQTGLVYAPAVPILLAALAVGQMGVHLVFFLHISSGPEDTNNILALAFGVFVVGLIVFGSMLIMTHLNANMMPAGQSMQMQP